MPFMPTSTLLLKSGAAALAPTAPPVLRLLYAPAVFGVSEELNGAHPNVTGVVGAGKFFAVVPTTAQGNTRFWKVLTMPKTSKWPKPGSIAAFTMKSGVLFNEYPVVSTKL